MLGSVTSVKYQFESPANTDYDLLDYFSSRQDVAGYQGMLTLEQNLFGDHRIYSHWIWNDLCEAENVKVYIDLIAFKEIIKWFANTSKVKIVNFLNFGTYIVTSEAENVKVT